MLGRPRRWATGIELTEEPVLDDDGNPVLDDDDQPVMTEINPIPEGHRAMISENNDAKFGQLNAADLGRVRSVGAGAPRPDHGRVHTSRALRRGVHRQSGVGRCPTRSGGQSDRPRRSQAGHVRAIVGTGRPTDDRGADGQDPQQVDVRVAWADAATRSVAQEADAVVKLYQAGLLPSASCAGEARLQRRRDHPDPHRPSRRIPRRPRCEPGPYRGGTA